MIEQFDIENLNKGAYCVGRLNQKTIDLLGLSLKETDIYFSKDKIEYTKKHVEDYYDYNEYKAMTERTAEIISTPDYIMPHSSGDSIKYIKYITRNIVVAVRLRESGILWVKTVFPITKDKLSLYKSTGHLIVYNDTY